MPSTERSNPPVASPPAPRPVPSRPRPGSTFRRGGALALAALAATDFLAVLDGLLVAVALPEIQQGLGFSQASLGWVITAYVLVFGGCLLLGGRAADMYGRRRVLLVGYAFFAAGALVGGLAPSPEVLIAGRAIQGLGAAAMTPAGLSLLTATFPPGPALDRALGIWAAAGSAGIPAGALLGGIISSTWGWRWVLLVNAPAAVLAGGLAWFSLAESKDEGAPRRLDLPGAILATSGLAAVIYAVTRMEQLTASGTGTGTGLGAGRILPVLLPLLAGAVLLAGFVAVEGRSPAPLLPFSIFRVPGLVRANVAGAALPVGLGAMLFLATQYLQQVHGLTAMQTGLAYLALALAVIAASPAASVLVARFGRRFTAVFGFALQTAGLLLLARGIGEGSGLYVVLTAFLLTGAGAPIAYVPVTAAAVEDVGDSGGLAAGLFNTTQQVGNALALSLMATGVAVGASMAGLSGSPEGGAGFGDGLRWGFLLAALLCALGAVAALKLRKTDSARV